MVGKLNQPVTGFASALRQLLRPDGAEPLSWKIITKFPLGWTVSASYSWRRTFAAQAGRYTRAAEFLLVAAKQAMNLSAPLQAKALYDRCLGLLRQIPQSPESIHLLILA
jgi:hypothetical protein